jgi:hypothetical protein
MSDLIHDTYPAGEERKRINAAMSALVDIWRETPA